MDSCGPGCHVNGHMVLRAEGELQPGAGFDVLLDRIEHVILFRLWVVLITIPANDIVHPNERPQCPAA